MVFEFEGLDWWVTGLGAFENYDVAAGGTGEEAWVRRGKDGEGVEIDAADGGGGLVGVNGGGGGAQVKPADGFVFGCGGDDVVIRMPDN